jgi:hypothetical protein
MRYESRKGKFVGTAVLSPIVSVLVAFALSASTNRLFLPIIGSLGDEPLALLFLAVPIAATVAAGRSLQRSRGALWTAGIVVAVATELLSYIVWIGWIVVVCGLQDNACFD